MVRALLSMAETPEPADAADALAAALCHLQTEHARLKFGLLETTAAKPRSMRLAPDTMGARVTRAQSTRI
jgi:uncharacterized MAPEG superfamily protein